jgi:hypothetical protein
MNRPVWVVTGALVAGLVLIIGLLGGILLGRLVPTTPAGRPAIAATPTVLRQVQGLHQLVTVRYVMEKVVILEDVKWYGENRLLMLAHGRALAGVDLGQLTDRDVVADGPRVTVLLPRAQLLEVALDDRRTQVIERSTGMLREFDKDLEQDARRQAVDQIRIAARDSGILRDADERARTQIENLLRSLGYSQVEVTTRP